jgi:predicted SAM-dependent methyltransferase
MGITFLKNNCTICKSELNNLFVVKKMPIFMGAVSCKTNYDYSDMTFTQCNNCKTIQIKELINPELLYQNNHNMDVVGELWSNHYLEFSNFIKNGITKKTVLELADPSAKIAKHISQYSKSWSIVEYNPNENINLPNVKFIKAWFDSSFDCDTYDVIIHSHFLEHLTAPIDSIKKMNECLTLNGKMYFSIPNLESILENTLLPTNCLHFEHTFFYTKSNLKLILNKFGFEVNRTYDYKSHSIFFECKKVSDKITFSENDFVLNNNNEDIKFLEKHNLSLDLVLKFNSIKNQKKYIFGCHISTQYLISMGIDLTNVICILDNSLYKKNKFLYGSDLVTKSVDVIKNDEFPVVLISHTGIYKHEIKPQLINVNKNVILI